MSAPSLLGRGWIDLFIPFLRVLESLVTLIRRLQNQQTTCTRRVPLLMRRGRRTPAKFRGMFRVCGDVFGTSKKSIRHARHFRVKEFYLKTLIARARCGTKLRFRF